MALERGAKIGHTQEDILQKLIMNGEFLQNSSSALLTELGIVDKLTYKFRNAHGKQKFYKYLEKIKKCLNRWSQLNIGNKVIGITKNFSDDFSIIADNLCAVIEEVMLGGQLAIKIIIICQETVQYSLAYLSRGFFVSLHVTLFSVGSRVWVLQKDCWTALVECYQLARLLIQQATADTNHLSQYPTCLKLWLREDVKKIFEGRDFSADHERSSIPFIQQLAREDNGMIAGRDIPLIFEEVEDLGEPVDEETKGCFEDKTHYFTLKTIENKVVGTNFTTNLSLKVELESKNAQKSDLEGDIFKNSCETMNNKMNEENLKLYKLAQDKKSKDSKGIKSRRKLLNNRIKSRTPSAERPQKVSNKAILKKTKRSLRRVDNAIFIKKTVYRFTLRNLLMAKDFCVCSTKRLRVLLRFSCVTSNVSSERKLLLNIQSSLQKELRRRQLLSNVQKGNRTSVRRRDGNKLNSKESRTSKKSCIKGKDIFRLKNDNQKLLNVRRLGEGSLIGSPFSTGKQEIDCLKDCSSVSHTGNTLFAKKRNVDDSVDISTNFTSDTLPKMTQNDCTVGNRKVERDEIDVIFGGIGL